MTTSSDDSNYQRNEPKEKPGNEQPPLSSQSKCLNIASNLFDVSMDLNLKMISFNA